MSSPRMLVVDDDPVVLRVTERLARSLGFEVVATTCPLDARRHVESESFDVVVSDVEMPAMRGPDLLSLLERSGYALPALFVSGGAELAPLRRDQRFLAKPFSRQELARELLALGVLAARDEG